MSEKKPVKTRTRKTEYFEGVDAATKFDAAMSGILSASKERLEEIKKRSKRK